MSRRFADACSRTACLIVMALVATTAAAQQKTAPVPSKHVVTPGQLPKPHGPVSIDTPTIRFSGAIWAPQSIDTPAIKFAGAPPAGPVDITTAPLRFAGVPKP